MNIKRSMIIIAILAASALVLTGCGDMFEKIKNPEAGKIVSQSAFQANDSTADPSASVSEQILSKIALPGSGEVLTGKITNPNGGYATFSGQNVDGYAEIDFTYTDWACSNPDLGDYTVDGKMHCSISMVLFNGGDPDFTDTHDTDGDTATTGDAHYHMYFKETGDAIVLTTGKDSRKTSYDLTSDYYAGLLPGTTTWVVSNSTYGKVGGKEIETFTELVNRAL